MRTRFWLVSLPTLVILTSGIVQVATAARADAAASGVTVAGGNGTGSAPNQLYDPVGVALDPSGSVYVADVGNERIQRWDPGATSGVTVAGGTGGSAADQFALPYGVAVDTSGNIFVADFDNNRVQEWAPGASSGVTVAGGNGDGAADNQVGEPVAVAVDSRDNVYVTEGYFNRVQRWAPGATSGVTVAGGHGEGSAGNQLDAPYGVAVDGAGDVYVADQYNMRVQRWAPGATSGVTVAGGNGQGSAANQLTVPNSVALDDSGNLYISDQGNNRVQRWAPGATSGVTVAGGNGAGSSNTQLNFPVGVAIDGNGNDVYISDRLNNRVQKWALAPPTVLPGVASVVEGNSGITALRVPVTLSYPSSETVTVPWTTVYLPGNSGNQADPATDYTPASGTVAFAPGQTSASVTILVNGDTLVEPDEYIVVSFHDPTNATMGGFWGIGLGTILNDDHATVVPGSGIVAAPSAGSADLAVPVTLSNPSTVAVTVQWTTLFVPGNPTDPWLGPQAPTSDYLASSGTVTFAPGQTSADVHIPVLADSSPGPDEHIVISFNHPTNATMGGFWGLGFGIITPAP